MNNNQSTQIITSIPGFPSRNPINVHTASSLAGLASIRRTNG